MIEIKEGRPPRNGLYVVYVNDTVDKRAMAAQRRFLMWFDGEWNYCMSDQRFRGHVYGWVGPIPIMKLEG